MSLIRCPECNKEVSSLAKTCPNCGYPIQDKVETIIQEPQTPKVANETIDIVTIDDKRSFGMKIAGTAIFSIFGPGIVSLFSRLLPVLGIIALIFYIGVELYLAISLPFEIVRIVRNNRLQGYKITYDTETKEITFYDCYRNKHKIHINNVLSLTVKKELIVTYKDDKGNTKELMAGYIQKQTEPGTFIKFSEIKNKQ